MKKLLFVVPFLLTGCFYQSTSKNDIDTATKICSARNSEVESINSFWDGAETLHCTDRKPAVTL